MKMEDFIRDNRSAFEEEGPSPLLWEKLEKQLSVKRKVGIVRALGRHWLKVAAACLILINSVFLMQFLQYKSQQQQHVMIPEIDEAGVYYTNQIEQRLELINAYPAPELGLDSTVRNELQLKNDTYLMLEKELQANPGNERIRAAMIRYYKMKLELLDKILEEHERHSTPKKIQQYDAEI
ncbi:hypothetical protein MKQ68_04095 [Chitinophaga horti]|uniref:Anti-sigma factor n=1 Tax=Chitinophaga horti TaxID=2920382 RepID=A0ABY6J3R6_9BACT|nr:hypothetical protein [Chitinophaga horti]UYQ94272.1 hypothetical protein MKQ68_04095 [Chitinophaga horti]